MSATTTAATVMLAILVIIDAVSAVRGPGTAGPFAYLRPVLRLAAALVFTVLLLARSYAMQFPAMVGRFDSRLLFAIIVLAVIGILEFHSQRKGAPLHPGIRAGSTAVAFTLVAIASAPGIPVATPVVLPALRSLWLPLHIAFTFVGEALFAVAAVTSAVWLVRRARGSEYGQRSLDALTYRMIAVGYAFFTVGALLFGAIWAHQAWGRWWGWDPKETWALVTWLIYSIYLHARLRRWGRGSVAHWLAVGGFVASMFTLFGVNALYSSIHAY